MLDFTIDMETCIGCGQCASDCPAMIIHLEDGEPRIPGDLEKFCIRCMHCVAICSEGSVSILGCGPDEGFGLPAEKKVEAETLELLIKGRRSIRNYQDKNLDSALIEKMLEVASHAPSGHNDRQLLYTLVDDKGTIYDLREDVFEGIEQLIANNKLPEGMEMYANILEAWKTEETDILFRKAPHLLVVSSPQENAAPMQDCIIALTTFELYAQSLGVGTVWNGLATLTISDLLPHLREKLGIPEDHTIGYSMGFGYPAVQYERTVVRSAPAINRVQWKF